MSLPLQPLLCGNLNDVSVKKVTNKYILDGLTAIISTSKECNTLRILLLSSLSRTLDTPVKQVKCIIPVLRNLLILSTDIKVLMLYRLKKKGLGYVKKN